jgi:hypothetical protein
MAMYSLNLMRIALELAQHNHVYEDIATTFLEHFLDIAKAMTNIGGQGIGLWDDEDGFFFDVLNLPDGPCRATTESSPTRFVGTARRGPWHISRPNRHRNISAAIRTGAAPSGFR